MENTTPVQSVKKALDLLDHIIARDLDGNSCSLGNLAQQMGMPNNSVHNLLKTLTACGYVDQAGRGVYQPGSKVRQIGTMNRMKSPVFTQSVTRCLESYVEQHNEACLLTMLIDGKRVVVSHMDSDHTIGVSREHVERVGFFELPTGRLLAAMANDDQRKRIIERQGLPGKQWDGINNRKTLDKHLAQLKKRGWCELPDPRGELVGLACAVIDDDGHCWAVAGSYAPLFRCNKSRRVALRQGLQALAQKIAKQVKSPLLSAADNGHER